MRSEFFVTTVGEQVTLQRGFDITKKEQKPGKIPVVSSGGVSSYHNEAAAKGPGVVLGRKGSLGTAFYLEEDYWPHDTSLWVKDFKDNNPRFVYYFFKSIADVLKKMDVGAANPTLNRNHVHPMAVRWPIRETQDFIASVLASLDDKIELNRRMNETLEAIARAIFKSWFVDFDPVRAKASGEAPESICRRLGLTPDLLVLFPERLVDSELGETPEGWKVKAVADVAKVVKGKSYKSSELAPSKTALVTLKSFNRGGGYRLDGLKEYTGSYKPEQEVIKGDVVVAYTDVTQAADVIGKPALVISDNAYEHLVISLDVAVVRPVRDEYRVYIYGVMSGVEFQQHTRAHTTGTTVLHLASNAVPGFKFIFPGEALVDFYATIAAPMFASIDEHVAEGRSLASLRDALLPKLLSGELHTNKADSNSEAFA